MAGYIGSKSSVTLVDGITKNGGTLEGDLSFGDNDKAIFGAGSDLQIYSDGTHSYLKETGSGNLWLGGANIGLGNPTASEYFVECVNNGAVKLYHDNAAKLATTSTGIDVTGTAIVDRIQSANDSSDPWLKGTNSGGTETSYIKKDGTGYFGGNVGVGTSSPSADFVVSNGGAAGIELQPEIATDTNRITNYDRAASAYMNFRLDALTHQFLTSGTERCRIDGSGNVFVARTAEGDGNVGHTFRADGFSQTTRSGGLVADFNRKSSDGDILRFQKDGTSVGSIGTISGSLYIGTPYSNDSALRFSTNTIHPCTTTGSPRDNAIQLGYSSARFNDIYATNGTIQTSDFNEKQDIASLTATEMLVGKRISALFKTFRWKDSVAEKGENARTHTGVIAQDVQAAFTAEGLDAGDYALFISTTWWETQTEVPAVEAVAEVTDEDGNVTTEAVEAVDAYTRTDTYDTEAEAPEGSTSKTRMGIRYPELLSFVAAYNEQRFASIEARLTALEA